MHKGTHITKQAHSTHYSLFSTCLSKHAHTHNCLARAQAQAQASNRAKYTHKLTELKKKKKKSFPGKPQFVFPGRSHFVMLTSFKCLRALMSYYGRQMARQTEAVSWLIHSGHDDHFTQLCPPLLVNVQNAQTGHMLGFKIESKQAATSGFCLWMSGMIEAPLWSETPSQQF